MMPEETARVLRVEGEHAVVVRERDGGCLLCLDPEECATTRAEENRCSIEIRARNLAGAATGDLVRVRLEGGQLLFATLLVYGVPLLSMAVGVTLGISLAQLAGLARMAAQGVGVLALVVALGVSMVLTRWVDRRLDRRGVFLPVVDMVREPGPAIEV